jgi:restriction system protein
MVSFSVYCPYCLTANRFTLPPVDTGPFELKFRPKKKSILRWSSPHPWWQMSEGHYCLLTADGFICVRQVAGAAVEIWLSSLKRWPRKLWVAWNMAEAFAKANEEVSSQEKKQIAEINAGTPALPALYRLWNCLINSVCGNPACRKRVDVNPVLACPLCHSTIEFCGPDHVYRSSCPSCNRELGEIPLKAVEPYSELDQQRVVALRTAEERDYQTWARSLTESAAQAEWRELHAGQAIAALDRLTGEQFEEFLAVAFTKKGYQVERTPLTGDKGADLILIGTTGGRVAVQAKRYTALVGITAVQEVLGGMSYYRCPHGIVITTSGFTRDAVELARSSRYIQLWDRDELAQQFTDQFDAPIPEFSWAEYENLRASLRYRRRRPPKRQRQGRRAP